MGAIKIPKFCGLFEGETISRAPHRDTETHSPLQINIHSDMILMYSQSIHNDTCVLTHNGIFIIYFHKNTYKYQDH